MALVIDSVIHTAAHEGEAPHAPQSAPVMDKETRKGVLTMQIEYGPDIDVDFVHYREFERYILQSFPLTKITGEAGRDNAFELTVNGELWFSKLKKKDWPDMRDVVDQMKKFIETGKHDEVRVNEDTGCMCVML